MTFSAVLTASVENLRKGRAHMFLRRQVPGEAWPPSWESEGAQCGEDGDSENSHTVLVMRGTKEYIFASRKTGRAPR